jgi:hypothetical protein
MDYPKTLEGWKHLNVLGSEENHEEIKRRLEAELERQRSTIGEAAYRHARGLASMAQGVVGGNRREYKRMYQDEVYRKEVVKRQF